MFPLFAVNRENEAKLEYGGETLTLLGPIVPYDNEVVYSREGIKAAINHRTG